MTKHVTRYLRVFPPPNFLDEFIATQVVPCRVLFSPQFLLNYDLSGNPRMVAPWIPQHGTAAHPVPRRGHIHCASTV